MNIIKDNGNNLFYNKRYNLYVNAKGEIFRKVKDEDEYIKVPEIVNSATGYKILENCGVILNSATVAFGAFFPEAMESKGRKHIDHINNDKTDNSINNLRLLLPKENARNKVKRGGRIITIHNPTTFKNKTFGSISECARYLKISRTIMTYYINTNKLIKGYLVKTESDVQKYRYYVDGKFIGTTIKDVAKVVGYSESYLNMLLRSMCYKNSVVLNGILIERKNYTQDEINKNYESYRSSINIKKRKNNSHLQDK